jgi:hypothetical protein
MGGHTGDQSDVVTKKRLVEHCRSQDYPRLQNLNEAIPFITRYPRRIKILEYPVSGAVKNMEREEKRSVR